MSETITIPRPHVPHGPEGVPANQADADYLRSAARNFRYRKVCGSNLTDTVCRLLEDAAAAIEANSQEQTVTIKPWQYDQAADDPAVITTADDAGCDPTDIVDYVLAALGVTVVDAEAGR